MFKQNNIKHILFYTISIVGVVILFNFVTAYGQANLKAPPKIGGTYEIEAKSISNCLQGDTLILKIEQSGLYLNGLLISSSREVPKEVSDEEPLSITGHFDNSEITLKGKIGNLKSCPSADPQGQVLIKASVQQQQLNGVLTSGTLSLPFNTVAKVEPKSSKKEAH